MNLDEKQYLDLIKKIIEFGEIRETRNSSTISIFSEKLEFNISNSIPFITTKKLAWKTIIKELLWFLSGSTDNQKLLDQNVKIWIGNSTREYMDSIGFNTRQVGDLGPVYGHQWRHFNAEYIDEKTDYTNKGVDQIQQVIHLLKTDPMSRRIILSAWNPSQINQMNLPPCHMFCQFYVSSNQELSCQMYQRSADVGLGLPFNIASYALLTAMIAQTVNMVPGMFTHSMGDTHIYVNHIDGLKLQLTREPKKLPRVWLNPEVKSLFDFKYDDIKLLDYEFHPTIKFDVAV